MTLKSEDESAAGSEGWPSLRMHYIKVCDPCLCLVSIALGVRVHHHLPLTHSCVWCEWMTCGEHGCKQLLTLAASITSTSVGDHLVLKHYNCQEGKY